MEPEHFNWFKNVILFNSEDASLFVLENKIYIWKRKSYFGIDTHFKAITEDFECWDTSVKWPAIVKLN